MESRRREREREREGNPMSTPEEFQIFEPPCRLAGRREKHAFLKWRSSFRIPKCMSVMLNTKWVCILGNPKLGGVPCVCFFSIQPQRVPLKKRKEKQDTLSFFRITYFSGNRDVHGGYDGLDPQKGVNRPPSETLQNQRASWKT